MYIKVLFVIVILFLCLMSSCGTSSFNMKPTDASIHEMYYSYFKDGKLYPSFGINGTKADISEVEYIRIYIPKKAKGRLLITEDGDSYQNIEVDDEEFIDIPVIGLEGRKTKVIGFSLATKNYSVSTGRMYLVGNLNVSEELKVSYTCPYKVDNGLIGSCTRPTGFSFYIDVHVEEGKGKMKIFTNGSCVASKEEYDLVGSEDIRVKLLNGDKGMCSVSIETRQGELKQAKILNINYYDSSYISLGKPLIEGEAGNYKIYPTDQIKSYFLNGERPKSKILKKYVESEEENILAVSFDKNGRVSYNSTYDLGEGNDRE